MIFCVKTVSGIPLLAALCRARSSIRACAPGSKQFDCCRNWLLAIASFRDCRPDCQLGAIAIAIASPLTALKLVLGLLQVRWGINFNLKHIICMRHAHEQIHYKASVVLEFNGLIVYRPSLIRTSRMWREIFKKIGVQHGELAETQVSRCVLRVDSPESPGRTAIEACSRG